MDESKIVESVTEAERLKSLVPNPGVPDGTIWTDVHGQKVKVVYEYDDASQVTGWHVEPQDKTK
jgi:hypothetical protein